MPTHYLISVGEVFEATGQNPDLMEASTTAVASAITRATVKLEQVVGGSFQHLNTTDTFIVSDTEGEPPRGFYRLRLSNGCLRSDFPVTITVADYYEGPYTAVTGAIVDSRLGVIQVPFSGMLGKYLKVSYHSGFKTGDTYPDELKQALLCFVPLLLLKGAAAESDPKQTQATSRATSLDSVGADMAASYMRRVNPAFKPIATSSALVVP